MRKNGSRLISLQQYRLTDLFLFALILALAELLAFFAIVWFPSAAMFTFSLTLPIALVVMMRWGWYGAFYAVGGALIYCLLHSDSATGVTYLVYCIGNACIALVLIYLKLVGKERIRKKWYLSVVLVLIAWLVVNLGRTVVSAIAGNNFWSVLGGFCGMSDNGLLTLAMAIIIVLVMRRIDGMFEDQKKYLLRLDAERKEKMRRDTYGDGDIDLDVNSLSVLKNHNDDLY